MVPSQGNFLLVEFSDPGKSASAVDAALRQKGIAIRRFASPAYAEYIRITIGHPQELQAVVTGITAFLKGEL